MRALRSVTEQTLTALDNHDVDEAKRQLAWIRSQTGRMSAMLSSLLDYSSIGRKIEAIECVDTRTVAEAIKDSVPAAGGKTIAVTGTWPVIETLKAPLDLVLRNLVDNAIKHHDRQTGAVTLSCAEVQDALKITVTDDGPGIQPAHREAIFLPFRTLAPADTAVDGRGMGLALVKRTLENVGGGICIRAGAESQRGTTFEVTWPRTIPL